MGGRLLYRDAKGGDASVDLPGEGAYLGRATDCIVRTDDAMVSRKNCKISYAGGRWSVEDLGSSNGTFVNEQRVQKQALSHADVIRCGSLQVRFVETADVVGKPKTMAMDAASSVQVAPELTGNLDPANLMALKDQELHTVIQERDALAARLRETAQEQETLNARMENDQAELKKARADLISQRDKLTDLQRQKSLQDEELHAQTKVAEELRRELQALKDEHLTVKTRADELQEEMAARDRQLERALEDVQRAKIATDELRTKMGDLQKTKDEGWRELNNRVGELDHLREVISEQERILEERRVGLISLEASVKDLRVDKEKVLRETVGLKNERDELRDKMNRQNATIETLEEEHRRLARAMADGGMTQPGAANDEHMRLATELRELKIEFKRLESERNRLSESVQRTEAERQELDDKHAKGDVDRSQLSEQKAAAEAARSRAEEALAKAETARQRIDEERGAATKARDAALASTDELRRELDREKTHRKELEADLKKAQEKAQEAIHAMGGGVTSPGMAAIKDAPETAEADGENAEQRIHELEEELSKLSTELAMLHESHGNGAAAPPAHDVTEIKARAHEAYTGINDALSELRTNILLAKDLVAQHGPTVPDGDAMKTLTDAIQVSMDRTEDAKGLLRSLREVVES